MRFAGKCHAEWRQFINDKPGNTASDNGMGISNSAIESRQRSPICYRIGFMKAGTAPTYAENVGHMNFYAGMSRARRDGAWT